MGDQILSMLRTSLQFALNIWNTFIDPYAGWWFSAVIICTVYRFLLHPLLGGGWGSDSVGRPYFGVRVNPFNFRLADKTPRLSSRQARSRLSQSKPSGYLKGK